MDRWAIEKRAYEILHQAYGSTAEFRTGQLEAIINVVTGRQALVVQKTGWGKSLVYFIATKILREGGSGPTLIISPLLALMDNQIESALLLGVRAETINSTNKDYWDDVYEHMDTIDALIVSPERLANERFMQRLASVRNTQLVVVDEAHAISDWGHDFRPDYQRVSKLIEALPGNVTILGTTATANDRVIRDIKRQLGENLAIVRGNLVRENLAIQVNPAQTREQRLAWLARVLNRNSILKKGQGIIYCLTHNDCVTVSEFLSNVGISILPYYSGMGTDDNGTDIAQANLQSFVNGRTRILAATVKLGMGYDKSDIRFVIHFQLPQNLIAYYQQIGRAGRDGLPSYAFLLHGDEDEEILTYFIQNAQANPNLLAHIIDLAKNGVRRNAIMELENVKAAKLDEALKYLQVHDYLYKDGTTYWTNPTNPFDVSKERDRQEQLTQSRIIEHQAVFDYLNTKDCFMRYIARELDAPDGQRPCGICANCQNEYLVPVDDEQQLVTSAAHYLGNRHASIEPRKMWGTGGKIQEALRMQRGWCLYADYYSKAGQRVRTGKYIDGVFSDDLVDASAEYLHDKVRNAEIDCVVPIPSLRRRTLVPDFAYALANKLGLSFADVVSKTQPAAEQKSLLNSAGQQRNIERSTAIVYPEQVRGKRVLLVDDMVDSRWSLTVVAAKLLGSGARSVHPYALVSTNGANS